MDDAGEQTRGSAAETALQGLMIETLKALAAAGEDDLACRLAARACAIYRHGDARAWNRFNGVMHRLAIGAAGAPEGGQG